MGDTDAGGAGQVSSTTLYFSSSREASSNSSTILGKTKTFSKLQGTSTSAISLPSFSRDYVAAILNTQRADSLWYLNLGADFKEGNRRVERGTGNVVSVEFAVLYHWHAALSDADSKWMEELVMSQFPGLKSTDDLTPQQFMDATRKSAEYWHKTPAKEWTFHGLQRGRDGRFDDSELAELIKSCIEEPAHAFGAHGTPASLKWVEIMSVMQARNVFNVCTMNE